MLGQIFDRVRLFWRKFKEPVQSGQAGRLHCLAVSLLSMPVRLMKRFLPMPSLFDRALYLMYHPECKLAACDAYRAVGVHLMRPEIDALREQYQLDMRHIADVLRVRRAKLDDLPCLTHMPSPKVAVYVHVFYREEGLKVMNRLHLIPCPFDLFISAPDGVDLSFVPFPCKVVRCENRGRNMMPFMCLLPQELKSYDYVCHLHTKRSPHIKDQRGWFDFLITSFLPSSDGIMKIFGGLEHGVGIISAVDYLKTEDPSGWGVNNRTLTQTILEQMGAQKEIAESPVILFPAGGMGWFRGDVISMFNTLKLKPQDFPVEPIPPDGTLAHVLERLLYVISMKAGFENVELLHVKDVRSSTAERSCFMFDQIIERSK